MGNINDIIKLLNRTETKKQESLKKRLDTVTYAISSALEKRITENCVLEAMEEDNGWGKSSISFVDKSGKSRRCILEVNKTDEKQVIRQTNQSSITLVQYLQYQVS